MLAELGLGGYNLAAPHLGLPSVETPTSAAGKLLDVLGIRRPSTTTEHLAETTAGDIAAFAPGGAAIKTGERALAAGPPASDTVRRQFFRGIRPSTAGIESAGDLQRYSENVQQSVRRIIETEGGKLPRSVEEFSNAIGRSKSATYSAYHPMAKAAENAGVKIDAMPAIEAMQKLAADPLADQSARVAARRLLRTVPSEGRVSIAPSRAEELIRDLNQRSGDFAETAKAAAAAFRGAGDALREQLIAGVEGAGFPSYGQLRRTWGALNEIEPDVAKATVTGLRQGPHIGLTELVAGGAAAAGHPVIAGGMEALKWLGRMFGSPDRAVQRLFETAGGQQGIGQGAAEIARGVGASALSLTYGAANAIPPELLGLRDRIEQMRQSGAQP